jgi:uncharacterized protein (TIGR02246 family)
MADDHALRRAADEAAVRNVIARIAQTADAGEIADYLALFTDDAEWVMPDNPTIGLAGSTRRGHEAIRDGVVERRAAGVQGPGSFTRHVITTVAVSVESDDVATARAYFLYYGETATVPALRSMGQYDDTFRRSVDGWKLSRRSITMG